MATVFLKRQLPVNGIRECKEGSELVQSTQYAPMESSPLFHQYMLIKSKIKTFKKKRQFSYSQ
jgi:hypothetical protein